MEKKKEVNIKNSYCKQYEKMDTSSFKVDPDELNRATKQMMKFMKLYEKAKARERQANNAEQ